MRLLDPDANKNVHHYNRHTTKCMDASRLPPSNRPCVQLARKLQTAELITPGYPFFNKTSVTLSTLETL